MAIPWAWLLILAPPGLWLLITFNSLINLRNQVNLAFSTIDAQLKQRFDLIPNLIETVKGYAAHERETLEAVTEARNLATRPDAGWAMQENLRQSLGQLIARAEAYPDLKASRHFVMLQHQLSECEAQIAAARRSDNSSVMDYNNRVEMFPSSDVANIFSFTRKPVNWRPDARAVAKKIRPVIERAESIRQMASEKHARAVQNSTLPQGPFPTTLRL